MYIHIIAWIPGYINICYRLFWGFLPTTKIENLKWLTAGVRRDRFATLATTRLHHRDLPIFFVGENLKIKMMTQSTIVLYRDDDLDIF